MLSYLAFVHHGIETAGNPFNDGKTLAQNCIKQLETLENPDQFPPRLLILLASPAYLDSIRAGQLLAGIFQEFDQQAQANADQREYANVELIGCTATAVFFDKRIHPDGSLLICLASRLLDVKVAAGRQASQDPEASVESLLRELKLTDAENEKILSFANQTVFSFFPFAGTKDLSTLLHRTLRDRLGTQIPILGGVASGDGQQRVRPGILFANRKVYRNAIVGASVESGTPFGMSFTQGLSATGQTFCVREVDPQDEHVIRHFHEGAGADVLGSLTKTLTLPVFANVAVDRDPVVDLPRLEGKSVRFNRKVEAGEALQVLSPVPAKMLKNFREGIEKSLHNAFLLNPIAGLGFRCAGLLHNCERLGLDLAQQTAQIEGDLLRKYNPYEKPFVGGFLNGEAGVDANGKSVLGNWGNATIVFGDELRFRTPVFRGFEKLTEYAERKPAESFQESTDRLTELIYAIGFPGALLSLVIESQGEYEIVAQSASGKRFKGVMNQITPYSPEADDLLATVAFEKKARLVLDSRKAEDASIQAASRRGVISQYIMPLSDASGKVLGLLQVDLGDISYDTRLYPTELTILASLGKIVTSGLIQTLKRQEGRIIARLDQAMSACLASDTIKRGFQLFIERALDAFDLRDGHVRIAQEGQHSLHLLTGVGVYFQESRIHRLDIDFADISPTAQAFRKEKTVVVNDPMNNWEHKNMCELWKDQTELYRRLMEVGSYANVPFQSERGERGMLNLCSSEKFFFKPFHDGALRAVSERAGFLLEAMRRKERESFLMGVSPQFSQIRSLKEIGKILENEIARFAKTVNAELASLYLWEEDRKRYILRAQYGWYSPEWLNAAYYRESDFWTGTHAIAGRPRHIPNLYRYYKDSRWKVPRYGAPAFGKELSDDFTVEAIGLQLRIGDDRLGVLTFYRPIEDGAESGFLTTDTELLQQGADNFASQISILQTHQTEIWRKDEHQRRQKVYDAMIDKTSGQSFEERVCRILLTGYHASKVGFYDVETIDDKTDITLKAQFRRHHHTGEINEIVHTLGEMQLVERTMLANRQNEKTLSVERIKFLTEAAEAKPDPRRSALEGLVRRVCIPLLSEKRLVGVVDLHWTFNPKKPDSPSYKHGASFLTMLGEVIGSAYGRQQTKANADNKLEEAESKLNRGQAQLQHSEDRARDIVQATSAYVLQHHHELRKIITEMTASLSMLKKLRGNQLDEESKLVESVAKGIEHETITLKRMVEVGGESDAVQAASAYILQHYHELRKIATEMTASLSKLKKLRGDQHNEEDELIESLAEDIENGTATLKRMIEIGGKMATPCFESLSLKNLTLAALDQTHKRYSTLNIEINCDDVERSADIWNSRCSVDEALLDIALSNLLDNSMKYMRPSSRRVLTLEAQTTLNRGELLIIVRDTGVGMSQQKIQQILKEFPTVAGRVSVGVTISRMILGLHGGRLNYDSVEGVGTDTIIYIPLDNVE